MADTSGCLGQLRVSDISCSTGGSEESDYVTALTSEDGGRAIPSSLFVTARSDSIMEGEKKLMKEEGGGDDCGSVEDRIERSKSHWSTLSGWSDDDEVAEVSNVEVFKALQMHPTWGGFFATFGYDVGVYPSYGELVVGEKFAEGEQAELYEAQVIWWKPEMNENNKRAGQRYVLKVFKKGTFLKHLQSQLPEGLLKFQAEQIENWASPSPKVFPRFYSDVYRGILLKDGRFAFLMQKEHFDLRNLIERKMRSRSREDGGPFSKEEAEFIMHSVAMGVNFLHSRDIVHRGLKSSNVLVEEFKSHPKWFCYVADYECSVGVIGTGFFRSPEILQACKGGETSPKSKVFSKSADVYNYGMTCYEILTGKLPFEDHPFNGNNNLLIDHVINQHLRPKIPAYVEDWMCELLKVCWHFDPVARPSFDEILKVLSINSIEARKHEESLMKVYGQDLKHCGFNEIPKHMF